jgi:hypothetical protein
MKFTLKVDAKMMQFNIVENSEKERAYYVNNVRFDRTVWRKCMELEIKSTEAAIAFQSTQIDQLVLMERAAQSCMDGGTTFELGENGREIYRQVLREIQGEIREAKWIYEEGKALINELMDKLED